MGMGRGIGCGDTVTIYVECYGLKIGNRETNRSNTILWTENIILVSVGEAREAVANTFNKHINKLSILIIIIIGDLN